MKPTDEARWKAVVDSYLAGGWATEGAKTDPGALTVLAYSGTLTAGYYDVRVWIQNGGDALEKFWVSHRNAANDGDLKSHNVSIPSLIHWEAEWLRNYKISHNEGFRIINATTITGYIFVSIFWNRRA